MYVKIFLLLFTGAVGPDQSGLNRYVFISSLLTVACNALPVLVDESSQVLLGKVFTHIARMAAEDFKTVVQQVLNDSQRLALQQAMRLALVQEQTSTAGVAAQSSQPTSSQTSGGLKINMSKYSKT